MDEVRAMAAAGESVGRAMGSGVRTVREGAQRAGRAGAQATIKAARQAARSTESQLADRGLTPHQLLELIENNAQDGKKAVEVNKRKLRKQQARTGRDLRKAGRSARRDLEKKIKSTRRRRRWPWVLGLIALGAAAVAATRRSDSTTVQAEDVFDSPDAMHGEGRHAGAGSDAEPSTNGSGTLHRGNGAARDLDRGADNRN
ncbi:hypothetical protein FHR81_003876 [Actinoalloteichus hoggarensis]|uniref:Uncharacterized protein n=1 Tax=Actinoalloteichus hoggarensis TaxID=1470176 RepID=A0A221VW09_9PSEU|nr:hypothetical protein [Actinoalloteichus hoggarensis]ASO17694.1 hypothetical protein AHOG_00085 [Actinoalloteichus hoggarensis]MBB5922819.1 hypothetical protein [Actinoalloteichus hoggarensis]